MVARSSRCSSHRSSLLRIHAISSEFQPSWPYNRLSRVPKDIACTPPISAFDTILPVPESLVPELEASGIDFDTAQRSSTAFVRAATRLKDRCEYILRKRYQDVDFPGASNVLSSLEDTISRQYLMALSRWRTSVFQMTSFMGTTITPAQTQKHRTSFKQVSYGILHRSI